MTRLRTLFVPVLAAAGCSLALLHCGGDPSNGDDGDGEGGAASGGTKSGGSSSGGATGGNEASGGTTSSGSSSSLGGGGGGGMGGACTDDGSKTHCCESGDTVCAEGWESACADEWNTTVYCCDTTLGLRRSCEYDGDFYHYSDEICLGECSGRSYGTGSCASCYGALDECTPFSGPFGEVPCSPSDGTCKVSEGGYALDCSGDGPEVLCTCDPDE